MSEVLSWGGFESKDLDLIVFGRGPGTFTGLRIGLSTVKGLGLAHDIPVKGVSSLEALAISTGLSGRIATLIDARRRELFAALYDVKMGLDGPVATRTQDEWVGPYGAVLDEVASSRPSFVVGNGVLPYREELTGRMAPYGVILPERFWAPSAFNMALAGWKMFCEHGPDDLDTIIPVYLREPDAKLPGPKP